MKNNEKEILKEKSKYELSRNVWTFLLLVLFGSPLMFMIFFFLENPRQDSEEIFRRVAGTILVLSVASFFASLVSLISLALRVKLAGCSGKTLCVAQIEYCNVSGKRTLFSKPGILTVDSFNKVRIVNWHKEVFSSRVDEPLTLIDTASQSVESHFFGLKKYTKRTFQILSSTGVNLLVDGFDIERILEKLRIITGNVLILSKEDVDSGAEH